MRNYLMIHIRRIRLLSILLIFIFCIPHISISQPGSSAEKILNQEQATFLNQLRNSDLDSTYAFPVARLVSTEFKSIQSQLSKKDEDVREKALRSAAYFIREISKQLNKQGTIVYQIPAAIRAYKSVLFALIEHRPYMSYIEGLSPEINQVLATSLSQYKESSGIDDWTVYKRIASNPPFILSFIETRPGFRYSDSLLVRSAGNDPLKFMVYMRSGKQSVREKVMSSKNIYLQQVVAISNDRNASELAPFIIPLAEGKLTTDSIIQARKDAAKYYQLLVNSLSEALLTFDSTSSFIQSLRNGIKEKALAFYTNQVNELHNEKDAVRFASVKGLRPQDIYYLITSCGDELYTSSYLGLYKRLMDFFPSQSADSLFQVVNYDQYRIFMRLAANYNVLADFLTRFTNENRALLVKKFIYGIEDDADKGLYKAMDIADGFTGLSVAPEIEALFYNELQNNLFRCKKEMDLFGIRLYSILTQVFDLVRQGSSQGKLWTTLGNYELLKKNSLQNKKGEIVELTLFYGDEDGIASYKSFLNLYTDTSQWQINKTNNWINIRSVGEIPIQIFANNPLEPDLDLKAQDSLVLYLTEQAMEPAVLIHRGHSYHLDKTLQRLRPSVKLAILGSCGGYNNSIAIAAINSDVQIIGSKKTGARSINDPIIDVINKNLLVGKDLFWPDIWGQLTERFSKDEANLALFSEYIPPSKNVSLFVLKLYMLYSRFA